MKNNKGFSLVELLVVIAIIAILTGYIIFRINSNRYDVELTSAGNIAQSTFIRSRDMARAPQQGDNISDILVVNGYGVQLPLVGATDISFSIFRDTIDSSNPLNENKFSQGDVNISTIKFSDSSISNIKVLKYIYYDINNVMSEDTNTTSTRDIVFNSKEVPTNESVFYNQNNAFTKVGISLQHTITKKEIRVWINANGDIVVEEYKPVMYTLTININGSGTTSVASGSQFEQGSSVVVSATASSGYTFSSWSGCNSVSGTQCTVVMSSNKTITVTFNPPPPPPYCGDGSCNGGETNGTCPGDCPPSVTYYNATYINVSTIQFTATSSNGAPITVIATNKVFAWYEGGFAYNKTDTINPSSVVIPSGGTVNFVSTSNNPLYGPGFGYAGNGTRYNEIGLRFYVVPQNSYGRDYHWNCDPITLTGCY